MTAPAAPPTADAPPSGPPRPHWLRRLSRIPGRTVLHLLEWVLLPLVVLLLCAVLWMKLWWLPRIDQQRAMVVAHLEQALGLKVSIGELSGNWSRYRPGVAMRDLVIYDKTGQAGFRLDYVDGTLSWRSLLHGTVVFSELNVYDPNLLIRRDQAGHIHVSGIQVDTANQGKSGFGPWLALQRDIRIHRAKLTWLDDMRGSAPLVLSQVGFRLSRSGASHALALVAAPPAQLASRLDLRARVRSEDLFDVRGWQGQVFAHLDYADVGAWKPWVDLPLELPVGSGGLRVWADLDHGKVLTGTADVRLNQVRLRARRDLPELELLELSGRLGWMQRDKRWGVRGEQLALRARDGLVLPPASFQVEADWNGQQQQLGDGSASVSQLDLSALNRLAAYLPFPEEVRQKLAQHAVRGQIKSLNATWKGSWPKLERYQVEADLAGLGWEAVGKVPGVRGFSGSLDATEKGGKAQVSSSGLAIHAPTLFEKELQFDKTQIQTEWAPEDREWLVKIRRLQLQNADLNSDLSGEYRTRRGTPGLLDIKGYLRQVRAQGVVHYLPLEVNPDTRSWLKASMLGGGIPEARVVVRGPLQAFPFRHGEGEFLVDGQVAGVHLKYAPEWPALTQLAGRLTFRNAGMDIHARSAQIFGVTLQDVKGGLPDLDAADPQLNIVGQATGTTAEFFKFVSQSPVRRSVDGMTDTIKAQGNGKLALKLWVPLNHSRDTTVSGDFQFLNNRLDIPGVPVLEQVQGNLLFTDQDIKVTNLRGVGLGGPFQVTANTAKDGTVDVVAKGRGEFGQLIKTYDFDWLRKVRGVSDWQATVRIKKQQPTTYVVETQARGVAVDLPVPLHKKAADPLSIRLVRLPGSGDESWFDLHYGDQLKTRMVAQTVGQNTRIKRVEARFGGGQPLASQPGIWVTGEVAEVDGDVWQGVLAASGSAEAQPDALAVMGTKLTIGRLRYFNRWFDKVGLDAQRERDAWKVGLKSAAVTGTLIWHGAGAGKVQAQLERLEIPADEVVVSVVKAAGQSGTENALPALDITANEFILKGKRFGKLELQAQNAPGGWKIQTLTLTMPEAKVQGDGQWVQTKGKSDTFFSFRLDVSDAGGFLARMGYPGTVKGGKAKVQSKLNWQGNPFSFDWPTLQGQVNLTAESGQFAKMDPGIGKLLGVLSLQMLPRRITLDFKDVFSDGFAFEEISGNAQIVNGIMKTRDMRIQGPAAKIAMRGEVDLIRETQSLRVKVVPQLADSVAVATGVIMANPLLGVGAFLLQKVLKDPLGQIISFEYQISGSWQDPKVLKVDEVVPQGQTGDPEVDRTRL